MAPTLRRDRAEPHAHRRAPSAPFERLEPRLVLSDTFYAWSDVRALPGYNAAYGEPLGGAGIDSIEGMSDDGRFMWSRRATGNYPYDTQAPYLVVDGRVVYPFETPGLEGAHIPGINSEGVAFAIAYEGNDAGRLFLFDLDGAQERQYIEEADLDAPADFDLALAHPLAITDSGGLLVKTWPGGDAVERVWMIIDGDVEYLWDGRFEDVNAQNEVIGYTWDRDHRPYGYYEDVDPMLWRPGMGSALNLRSENITVVGAIADDGAILADMGVHSIQYSDKIQAAEQIVLWRDGQIEPLGYGYEHDPATGEETWYTAEGRDAEGRLFLRVHRYGPDGSHWTYPDWVVADPDGEVHILAEKPIVHDMTRAGMLVGNNGWFAPIDPGIFRSVLPGEQVTVWVDHGEIFAWTRSADGKGLRFRQSPDGVTTVDVFDEIGIDRSDLTQEVLREHSGWWTMVFTNSAGNVSYYQRQGHLSGPNGKLDDIHGAVAHVFRPDGEVAVVYMPAPRQLEIAYLYKRSDLSEHLVARGLETPDFVGRIDSFVTPWWAQNVIGLDAAGDVHAVWWSHGLRSRFWTTSNLSRITGAPKLVGDVVGTAVGDDGMRITGADERGHLIVLQWSASAGQWSFTDATAAASGPALEPATLTIQAGRWGGLGVVARSDAGEVVCYWWSDASGWRAETARDMAGADTPAIAGPVSYFAYVSGEQHIAGSDASGRVIDIYWKPDGQGWRWQDLTALAMT